MLSNYLPKFPKFKKLDLSDQETIKKFTSRFPPYSDFNFVSMYTWDINDDMEITNLNGNLAVKFKDYTSDDYFYSFLGDKKPVKSARELIRFSYKHGFGKKLKLVPEIVAKSLKKSKKFIVEEDRDNFDYILDVRKIASGYLGRDLYQKKKKLAKFKTNYNYNYLVKDGVDFNVLLQVFEKWKNQRGIKTTEIEDELKALKRVFDSNLKGISSILLTVEKETVGFMVYECLEDQYAISSYQKALPNYKGVFEAINHFAAESLMQKGYSYLNIEQDLGISGLREAKRSYSPSFLRKYIVTSS